MKSDNNGIEVIDVENTNKGLLILLNILVINKDDKKNYFLINGQTEVEISDNVLSAMINQKVVDYIKESFLNDDFEDCE